MLFTWIGNCLWKKDLITAKRRVPTQICLDIGNKFWIITHVTHDRVHTKVDLDFIFFVVIHINFFKSRQNDNDRGDVKNVIIIVTRLLKKFFLIFPRNLSNWIDAFKIFVFIFFLIITCKSFQVFLNKAPWTLHLLLMFCIHKVSYFYSIFHLL